MIGSRKVWSVLAVAMLCVSASMSAVARSHGADDPPGDDRGGGSGSGGSGGSNSGGGGNGGNNSSRRELKLQVQLRDTDSSTKARVRYSEKNGQIKSFDVEIQRAQPGQTFAVIVQGTTYATLTANSLGRAKVEFRRTPDGGDMPIPAGFPVLAAGAVVTVGDMSGPLAAKR